MGLFDRFDAWKARLGGDPEKIREAEKKALLARAAEAERRGAPEEAAIHLEQAGEPLRAAQAAQRAGDFGRAAELFAQARRPLEAARAAEMGKDWARAGDYFDGAGDVAAAERCLRQAPRKRLIEFYVRRQRWAEAGKAAEEENDPEAASAHYEKGGDVDAAAGVWRRAGKLLAAAELLARHGRCSAAARAYEETGLPTKAVEFFAKAGDHVDAARLFGQMASNALATSRHAPQGQQKEALQLARRAAEHHLAAGDPAAAAGWFVKSGDPVRAAGCLGGVDPRKAAALYEEAGDPGRAAEAWEKAGEIDKARLLRARVSDPVAAAGMLAAEGRHAEAGDLLQKIGKPREAAAAYREAGRPAQAAELLLGLKDLAGAAACYEQAGLLSRAEPLYRQAGDDDGLLRLLLRRNDPLEAGKVYIRRREFDLAISSLQKLPSAPDVCGLLAHCFRARGMLDQALLKYEEAVAGRRIARETVGVYYEYARALEEKGQTSRAMEILTTILSVDLDYGDVRDRLEKIRAHAPTRTLPSLPDRYEVHAELDRGGEAVVFLAHDRLLDRKVALKVLSSPAGGGGLLAEARHIAGLSHPNIVTLFEIHEDSRGVVLVLEYLEGETLRKRIDREGALPPAEVARVGREIGAALQYAHERGLIHRDVKPANVMLLPDGAVKVLDFGMARPVETDSSSTFCGTPLFMAPEQILCRRPDARTDVYGLGATLYCALTGRPPFQGEDVFYQHLHCLPASPRTLAPATPPELDALLLRCLAKSPDERPGSAAEVVDGLKAP